MRLPIGLSVVLLAYQEAQNLRVLLPAIKGAVAKIPEETEIIVIDSKQTLDDTENVCKEFDVRYIPQEHDGYAGAFKTGVTYARMNKFLMLDADGSHNPITIPTLYEKFMTEKHDIVIGSRYVKGGKTHDSFSSVLMSRLLNWVMRLVLGVNAHDISTSFRIYDAEQLKNVKLTRRHFDVLQEVVLRMKLNNPSFSVGEVPIDFGKRLNGMSTRRLFLYIINYLQTAFVLSIMRFRHK